MPIQMHKKCISIFLIMGGYLKFITELSISYSDFDILNGNF